MDRRAGWALAPLLACTVGNPLFVVSSGEGGATTGVSGSPTSGATSEATSRTTSGASAEGSGEGGTRTGTDCGTGSTTAATATGEGTTTCLEGQEGCGVDPCARGEGCTGSADWLVGIGNGAIQRGSDAALLDDGGVAVVGSFAGQLGADGKMIEAVFDPLQGDGYLLRYSPDGELLWLRALGGPGLQWTTTAVALPGGKIGFGGNFSQQLVVGDVILAAMGNNSGFVGVFAADGGLLWVMAFGAGDVYVRDLAATADGGLVVVGDYVGGLPIGDNIYMSAGLDPFIARFDAGGQPVWSVAPSGNGPDGARGVAVGPDGAVAVTGYFSGALSLGGVSLGNQGGTDVFVARYGPDGKHLTSAAFGGPAADFGSAVAIGPTGRMVIAGTHGEGFDPGGGALPVAPGGFNAYTAVFEPEGALAWARGGVPVLGLELGAGIDELGRVVVLVPAGLGDIDLGDGAMPSTPGLYLAKYASDGALAWAHSLQGGVALFGHGLDVDVGGRVAVSGSFNNTLMYPAVDSLSSAGEFDVFAGRFKP